MNLLALPRRRDEEAGNKSDNPGLAWGVQRARIGHRVQALQDGPALNNMTNTSSDKTSGSSRRGQFTRVLLVYLGVSFAVLESADIFTDQLGLPRWFFIGTVILIALGLPVVLTTWFVRDLAQQHRAVRTERGELSGEPGYVPSPELGVANESALPGVWLTWRRAIIGGALVLAFWGLFVAAFMMMRSMGIGPVGSLVAAGVIDEREAIILADFENYTGDPLLGHAATEAFRIDLSQSTVVTLVPAAQVDRALVLMRSDPGRELDETLAREVAVREGIKAVIAGEINPVGSGYVLTAELISAQDGQVLAASRETARDSTEIIGAIDQLSNKIRERVGESLRTIRRSEPLDQVTTTSLEALTKYSEAVRVIEQGEHERAVTLLEEAVLLDSEFAMAWRKLGITLGNLGRDRARQIEALTEAYERRDRLSDRERLMTEGSYYAGVTGENDRAAEAYQAVLDLYPNDTWALNNQALIFLESRDYHRASENFERAIEIDSTDALFYGNVLTTLVAEGKHDRAESYYAQLNERFPDHPTAGIEGIALATSKLDYDLAEERLQAAQAKGTSNRLVQLGLAFNQAQLAEIRGHLDEAETILEGIAATFEQQGDYGNYIGTVMRIAFYDVMLRGDPERGIERMEAALARHPLEEIDELERPYDDLALFYALSGQSAKARDMLAKDSGSTGAYGEDDDTGYDIARAVLAIDEGRGEEAVEHILAADRGSCAMCTLPLLGQIYDEAGQADSALVIYERYIETPWLYRLAATDWWALASVYERLGGLYELQGDIEMAGRYYSLFVQLWENADPALQPRVDAARRALERLAAESQNVVTGV